jgi:hypothetical protein
LHFYFNFAVATHHTLVAASSWLISFSTWQTLESSCALPMRSDFAEPLRRELESQPQTEAGGSWRRLAATWQALELLQMEVGLSFEGWPAAILA